MHSSDQAAHNHMDHTGSDGSTMQTRVEAEGFQWTSLGENVASGQLTVDQVMQDWMNSPGHRANILGDYKFFGGGLAYNNGKTYWTQDFGNSKAEICGCLV